MRTAALTCVFTLCTIVRCQDPHGYLAQQEAEPGLQWGSVNCKRSHATRYSMARGREPVAFTTSSLDDFEMPAIEPMNATGGEQWEFDGISADGMQAFTFGFYRDPNYSILGTGNLRAYAEFALANGSRYAIVDYAEEAVVESCPGRGTRGTWRGDGFVYSFEISSDYSETRVTMENPEASATVLMKSLAPARYADNALWPADNASLLAVPHFYWVEPVPVADLTIDAVIEGKTVSWKGLGGHERLWGAFNWYTCLRSLVAVRILAGPYALSLVEFGSDRHKGLVVPSLILAENGQKVFATRRATPSDKEDHMRIRKLYGGLGATTANLADKVTGVELILDSPRLQKRWRFVVTHRNLAFEYVLGEGVGGTAYSGTVQGGMEGEEQQWAGAAFTEIMEFPQKSWLLQKNFV